MTHVFTSSHALAQGGIAAITAGTAPNAALHWVGGPLDSTYVGSDTQKGIWTKLTTAQGEQKATVSGLAEAANPKGATVTADVVFAGKTTVKVRYVKLTRTASCPTRSGRSTQRQVLKIGEGRNRGLPPSIADTDLRRTPCSTRSAKIPN